MNNNNTNHKQKYIMGIIFRRMIKTVDKEMDKAEKKHTTQNNSSDIFGSAFQNVANRTGGTVHANGRTYRSNGWDI